MKLAIEELDRRTCGDYIKSMQKGTLYRLVFFEYVFKKLNDGKISVEITDESFSNSGMYYGRKKWT